MVDLSETCQGFYHILERSDRVYTLYEDRTVYGQAMLSHYKKLLKAKEYHNILAHSVEFALPGNWEEMCTSPADIALSPIGAYMKGVLDNGA